jgi:D-alanyl-D-alanine carboxypeptidase
MKKAIITAVLFSTVCCSTAQTFNAQLSNMLQDTLNTYVSQISNIKGMSASVYIPGQGVWTGVSGNSYTGQPITGDMRFGIASNSKLFASVMMLKLAENNIISLEDSLHDWLTISNANINPNITIRQLLNHTSGISDPFFTSPWFDTICNNATRVFTPNEVLGWVGAPLFAAGTSYGYSNTNYVLAGMVAQSATGHSLATLIRDNILTPLNMDSTFIDVEEPVNGTIAHRWWNRVVNPVTQDYHDTSRVGLNSAVGYAGSIFSTSSEMVQWYNALFSGQVINESSMNELTTFIATSNPAYQYGLGLSRDLTQGLRYWGHGGRTWGYKSRMIYDTCLHVSVAGLSNADPSGVDAVTFLLYRAVRNHIPGCCGAITGPVAVMEGTNSVTYTVPAITNATTYVWTLPSGVTGTSSTNSITVDFGLGALSGNISVTGVNSYGAGGSSSLWVNVYSLPLPAEVLSFTVVSDNSSNTIEWTTASEINTDYFSVERSVQGVDFESLAHVKGAGISSVTLNYSWTDFDPPMSSCYYQLVQTDFDGKKKIYGPLGVKRNEPTGMLSPAVVFPNPFSDKTNLYLKEYCASCVVEVYNSMGQKLMMKNFSGFQTEIVYTGMNGLYFLSVREGEKPIVTAKIIVEK